MYQLLLGGGSDRKEVGLGLFFDRGEEFGVAIHPMKGEEGWKIKEKRRPPLKIRQRIRGLFGKFRGFQMVGWSEEWIGGLYDGD